MDSAYALGFGTSGVERLRITSVGNVGIKNASPTAQLQISGDGIAQNQLRLNHTGSGTNGFLDLSVYDTRAVISTNYSSTNIPLEIKSLGNTNQLYLATTSNVLVGTSVDGGQKFQVSGSAYITGLTNIGATGGGSHQLNVIVNSGADNDMFLCAVLGVSNGFRVRYNNATSTVRVSMSSLPTSSVGLSAGDLWNNLGILNIV
jgi:hypothetical protein